MARTPTKKETPLTAPEPLTLPGGPLAAAWLNAALAASDDDARPVLCGVLVEVFDGRGVQFVATDSYMVLGSFVPIGDEDAPTLDESPDSVFVVLDPDKRMHSLMGFTLKAARAAAKAGLSFDVTLSVGSAEEPDKPTLDPTLDRAAFVVEVERERLALPIYEGEYPGWRGLLAGHNATATEQIAFNPLILGTLGKLKCPDATPLVLRFDGDLKFARISAPPVFGALMPIRMGESAS